MHTNGEGKWKIKKGSSKWMGTIKEKTTHEQCTQSTANV